MPHIQFKIPDKRFALLLIGLFILCIAPVIGSLADTTHRDTLLDAPRPASHSHTRGTA